MYDRTCLTQDSHTNRKSLAHLANQIPNQAMCITRLPFGVGEMDMLKLGLIMIETEA